MTITRTPAKIAQAITLLLCLILFTISGALQAQLSRRPAKTGLRNASLTCNNWLKTINPYDAFEIGDLDISGNQMTIEATFNRIAPYLGAYLSGSDIVSKHSTPSDCNYLLRPNDGEITTTNGFFATPAICYADLNKTYHVAMVYDGTTLKFYRNGFLMSQVAATGNLVLNNWTTTIGDYAPPFASAGTENMNGYINEVRIWNTARSQAQIQAYMNTSLPNPSTQTGLQAYYTFDNLLNKQGNATWDGVLTGNAAINTSNPNCTLSTDSCDVIPNAVVTAGFTAPDTVCINTPVKVTNTSVGASTYYWNFCTANLSTTVPIATNLGGFSGAFSQPVFMDYVFTNNNYYGFITNYANSTLSRLDFGNSLLNTPVVTNLGNFGSVLPAGVATEGIQIVYNEGHWYAIIVADYSLSGGTPRVVKLDFGANITNPSPIATNWGNLGSLLRPVDLYVFNDNGNWYGLTVNAENNTITRFNFTNSFNNTPTGVNLGNVGNLAYPTGIYAINDNGNWRVFVVNGGNNTTTSGPFSLSRLDFGSSLLNTPTAVNLGSLNNVLQHPRDITIMKSCGQIVGFVVNGNPNYNDLVRLDFNNDLTSTPTAVSLGNSGNFSFPHSISRLFRVNDELYSFITNAANNTIDRLRFTGCTNASISSSTLQNPPPITYNTPGIYNINLTIDDGLPSQNAYCKQVVVLAAPVHSPTKTMVLCQAGDSVKIGTGNKNAHYLWNDGATTTDSAIVKTAGTYWVESSVFGCTARDSFIVVASSKPIVNLGPDTTLCTSGGIVLDAGNPGDTYLWQDGSVKQTYAASVSGKYYVTVANALGCTSKDTVNIVLNAKPVVDFGIAIDPCNPLAVTFTNIGNSTLNPYWSFGDGTTTTGNLNPLHMYPSFANYTVKFSLQNSSNACTDTVTKSISVAIALADIISTPDTTICYGSTKTLYTRPALSYCWSPSTWLDNSASATPVTSTPQKITYYCNATVPGTSLIVNGDFSAGNTGFTSGYQYANPNTTEGQYFTGTTASAWNASMASCTDHTTGNGNMLLVNGASVAGVNVWKQTVNVTPNTNYAFSTWIEALYPPNPAQLQFSINGKTIGSAITASLPTCTWARFYTTWNSGNSTSALISIVNQNTQIQGNDFALDDIGFSPLLIQRDSVVISIDTLVVTTIKDTSVCKSSPVQLTTSGAATYAWSPATGLSNAAIANPVATPVVSTRYIVAGTTVHGCTAKDTVFITVNPLPTIIASNDTTICHNTSVQLSAQGGVIYLWSPAATLNNPSSATPIASPLQTTTYTVTVTDNNTCTDSSAVIVTVQQVPQFSVSGDTTVCLGSPVQLVATGGDKYTWIPPDYLSDPSVANPIALPAVGITEYQVKILASACKDSTLLTASITVLPVPTVTAQKSNDIDCTTPLSMLSASGADNYTWSPATGLNDSSIANPLGKPAATTTYIVKGVAANGCPGYDSVTVKVTKLGELIFSIPNAFTPNGDGHNDCFGAGRYSALINSIELSVYNRWGQCVFHSTDPGACWDGTFKGQPQDTGGFPYIIRARTLCGEVIRKGVVMLIR